MYSFGIFEPPLILPAVRRSRASFTLHTCRTRTPVLVSNALQVCPVLNSNYIFINHNDYSLIFFTERRRITRESLQRTHGQAGTVLYLREVIPVRLCIRKARLSLPGNSSSYSIALVRFTRFTDLFFFPFCPTAEVIKHCVNYPIITTERLAKI